MMHDSAPLPLRSEPVPSLRRTIFITATDTGAGKTWLTAGLTQQLLQDGIDTLALKPIASGMMSSGINEDVAALCEVQRNRTPSSLCFRTFKQPLAPALAANLEQDQLDTQALQTWVSAQQSQANITLIEGVGGLMVPLVATSQQSWLVSDWLASIAKVEVMLVVPLRLGCMNHALLSCQLLASIQRAPTWIVFNDIHANGSGEATIQTLRPQLESLFVTMPQLLCVADLKDLKQLQLHL